MPGTVHATDCDLDEDCSCGAGLDWVKGDRAAVREDVLLESGVLLAAGQQGTVFAVEGDAVGFEWAEGGCMHAVALARHKLVEAWR